MSILFLKLLHLKLQRGSIYCSKYDKGHDLSYMQFTLCMVQACFDFVLLFTRLELDENTSFTCMN